MTTEIRPNNQRKHFDRKTHNSAACTNRARLLEYEGFAPTHSFKLAEARAGGSGAAAAGSSGPSPRGWAPAPRLRPRGCGGGRPPPEGPTQGRGGRSGGGAAEYHGGKELPQRPASSVGRAWDS